MEYNDIYTVERKRTGRLHLRGTPWGEGEYGLVVCVWVMNRRGQLLLTQRAPEKSFAGTWENSGGCACAGEDSLTAICRELREETGIEKMPAEFQLLRTVLDGNCFYDHYSVFADQSLGEIVLQPGETVDARWLYPEQVRQLIAEGKICDIIAEQYLHEEPVLLQRMQQKNG